MNNLLQFHGQAELLKDCIGMFTKEQLETATPIINICPHCNQNCGTVFLLKCCAPLQCSHICCGGVQMCGACLDDLYDNYDFKCPECYRDVVDYEAVSY